MHLAVVSGFPNKIAALSFEWHWKHAARKRKIDRLFATGQDPPFLRAGKDAIDNRILDLLYLTHCYTWCGDQYKQNSPAQYPQMDHPLEIRFCIPVIQMCWPAHVTCQMEGDC